MQTRTLIIHNGHKVWATKEQAETMQVLSDTRKGGFARIYGYVATSDRTSPTVYDATVTTRFSYKKLVERKKAALLALTLADCLPFLNMQNPKLGALTKGALQDAFDARKASEVASFDATGNDDRSDAHRQGHDRCYLNIADGVVVHYATVKVDGLMQPVLTDGFPTVDSIMLNCLEVSRTVREAGVYKVVNSGVPVLLSNAMKAAMKAKGVRSMNRVSLKEGNFERVSIDGEVVLPEDVVSLAA